ncbi:MAG: hypothetical protein WKF40_05145 [Thermoleophilaceae bacterium]
MSPICAPPTRPWWPPPWRLSRTSPRTSPRTSRLLPAGAAVAARAQTSPRATTTVGRRRSDDDKPRRRRRGRRGGRGRARTRKALEGSFDHGDEGYGLWLDPAVQDDPVYAEHWAGHRPVTVTIEPDRIVITRAGEEAAASEDD